MRASASLVASFIPVVPVLSAFMIASLVRKIHRQISNRSLPERKRKAEFAIPWLQTGGGILDP